MAATPIFAEVQAASAAGKNRPLVDADDSLHSPPTDHLYWTETSWWSFNVPRHALGGWIYLHFRPNLGVSSQGLWLWDDSGHAPWELPYLRQDYHLPMPLPEQPTTMAAGVQWECVDPLQRHVLRFDGSPSLRFELEFDGVAPARPVGITETTGHLDQAMWVTGTLALAGCDIQVDNSGFRDRTWSVRVDDRGGRRAFYSFGVARDFAFHAQVIFDEDARTHWLEEGFIWRDGRMTDLRSVERRVTSRAAGRPSRVELDIIDADGREWEVWGQAASGAFIQSWPGFDAWATTVGWHIDGRVVWGEDHDTWTPEHFSEVNARRLGTDVFASQIQ